MNGFAEHGLDEGAFGEKTGNLVKAFDAFPKSKPQYVTRTSGGGKWTVGMIIVSVLLVALEASRWWQGHEEHTFAVEKGVSHDLQINMDIVVKMQCSDLHINVQDAAGDRVLAAQLMKRESTNWDRWATSDGIHRLGMDRHGKVVTGEGWQSVEHDEGFGQEHVHDIVAQAVRKNKWSRTPRLKGMPDSCRIFGSLSVNKVMGDFHITARGHGYQEFGGPPTHLDHTAFNFSHIVSELSFGAFYPSLVNPLDRTVSGTPNHFHRFQYFMSVVPTVYSVSRPSSAIFPFSTTSTLFTNQYAVTEQSYVIGERAVPGIFFKYDIEPILLIVDESRESFLRLCVRVVNILSGVLVAGHWGFTISEWVVEVFGRRARRKSEGVLNGKAYHDRED